jgi:hypothetical protein
MADVLVGSVLAWADDVGLIGDDYPNLTGLPRAPPREAGVRILIRA